MSISNQFYKVEKSRANWKDEIGCNFHHRSLHENFDDKVKFSNRRKSMSILPFCKSVSRKMLWFKKWVMIWVCECKKHFWNWKIRIFRIVPTLKRLDARWNTKQQNSFIRWLICTDNFRSTWNHWTMLSEVFWWNYRNIGFYQLIRVLSPLYIIYSTHDNK